MGKAIETIGKIMAEPLNEGRKKDFRPYRISLEKTYPVPVFSLFYKEQTGTLPLGDIAAIKGKAKQGKSAFSAILAASVLGCKDFGFSVNPTIKDPSVFYFDTEQSDENASSWAKNVYKLKGWLEKDNENKDFMRDRENFQIYTLRGLVTPKEKFESISDTIEKEKPTVAIIDGAVDLVTDFNNIAESSEVIGRLLRLASDNQCSIICCLHTNKGKEDSNMRGHLGSYLVQKATDVFEVKHEGRTFTAEQTECRNKPLSEKIPFIRDNENEGTLRPTEGKTESDKKLLKKLFGEDTELRSTDLVKRIREEKGYKDDRQAKNLINGWKKENLISKGEGRFGKYRLM